MSKSVIRGQRKEDASVVVCTCKPKARDGDRGAVQYGAARKSKGQGAKRARDRYTQRHHLRFAMNGVDSCAFFLALPSAREKGDKLPSKGI